MNSLGEDMGGKTIILIVMMSVTWRKLFNNGGEVDLGIERLTLEYSF